MKHNSQDLRHPQARGPPPPHEVVFSNHTVHATSTCRQYLRQYPPQHRKRCCRTPGRGPRGERGEPATSTLLHMPACTFMFPCIPSWHDARWMLLILLVGIHHKRAYSMCHWRQVACSPQRPVLVHNQKRLHVFMCSLPFALLLFLHSPLEPVDIVIGTVRISSKTLGLLLGRRSALRT